MLHRGAFIVFEGCDRSGKSTQSKKLLQYLTNANYTAELMNFPNRQTVIGKLINDYLKTNEHFDDHVIHLLFAANRWEFANEIKKKLLAGVTLIVDRYSFSGVAYSAVKQDMDIDWCKAVEVGLPKPDCVFFMDVVETLHNERLNGDEIYETPKFQQNVKHIYNEKLFDNSYWHRIDASGTIDDCHNDIVNIALNCLKNIKNKNIDSLW